MKPQRLGKHHIVLMGVGHTNAHVARMWKMNRLADAELTCISDRGIATYSGMMPAALAGQIPKEQMEIDLVRFCSFVGARLIIGKVLGIDQEASQLLLEDRPPVHFDVLSIGIGSVPTVASLRSGEEHLLKIKPMQTFLVRLADRIQEWKTRNREGQTRAPLRVSVVGSGIAGIEILLCLEPFLRSKGVDSYELSLVTRSSKIFQEGQGNTRRRIEAEIHRRGHRILCNRTAISVTDTHITFSDGDSWEADLVVWATGATAPPNLEHLGLATDTRGFLTTDSTLRVAQADCKGTIFAVGDTGTIAGNSLPKAGVYAVRQGPILWQNIENVLRNRPLLEYKPQQSFLSLINLGDGRAIGQWKGFAFCGKWAYQLKHQIDSKFMQKFEPVPMVPDDADEEMQCQGCGCKFAASSLDSVLSLAGEPGSIVPDDAAKIGGQHANASLYASTDFFTNPVYDAFLFGRLSALHSASDLIATGVGPTEALANVVLPEGHSRSQETMLAEFTAGAAKEFSELGTKIVGGHTIVGPRMEAGFTVIGKAWGENTLHKSGLQPNDSLFLTKPLGIGVLLAAHMRSLCTATEFEELLGWMLKPQHQYAQCAVKSGVIAATDVTGFGLAGHLLEMLRTSSCLAHLELNNTPILPSALKHSRASVASSLLPSNLALSSQISASETTKADLRYPLLFDPQTCGGILFGVASEREDRFLDSLAENELDPPIKIGRVSASTSELADTEKNLPRSTRLLFVD